MGDLVYERIAKIAGHEVDYTGRWRVSSVVNAMQGAAERHGAKLGLGKENLEGCGVFWVISRMRVEMKVYPTWGEEIIIATWPHNIGNRIFPRCFKFIRFSGEVLGEAVAIYLLMDKKAQRITRAPERLVIPDTKSEGFPPSMGLGKLITDQEMVEAGSRRPRYSDLDMNNHMNNERYAEWICDLFEPERFLDGRIETMQINFLAETKANENITLLLHEERNQSWICGRKDAGIIAFEALCTWHGCRA